MAQGSNQNGQSQPVYLTDVNGTPTSGGGGGGDALAANQTATQANPGSNATRAEAVQGIDGGKPVITSALVVTGDQNYAIGSTQALTMSLTGGLKVGVSYNANIVPAAPTAGGLNSALIGGKYLATRPTWADGNTGALQVDSRGNLYAKSPTLDPTGGTNLSGQVTTTSGIFNIPANANRRPGDVQGQNVGSNPIYFNEFGGTAVPGAAGTWGPVDPKATFVITTNQLVNFISTNGASNVTIGTI